MDLQNKLNEVEEKIRFARQFYNDAVMTYKNKLEMFPSNIVAKMFGFKPKAFFEATEDERKKCRSKILVYFISRLFFDGEEKMKRFFKTHTIYNFGCLYFL